MPASYPASTDLASTSRRWDRATATANIVDFEQARRERATSQRAFATEADIPRTTLQHRLARKSAVTGPDPAVVAFFESPAGLAFLHRLVLAARFVITEVLPGGIRPLGTFLQLSQLDTFVAASYGPLQRHGVAMEEAIVKFATQEQQRLGRQMPPREITVCEDETFHPQTCLVGIEPISNFILLERYSAQRDEKSWSAAMKEATADLKVDIIQVVSDEAKGLLAHAREGPRSPSRPRPLSYAA